MDASGNGMPRVMSVDRNPAYPAAVEALKRENAIPRRVALRRCKYLNNVIEQDHRTVKKRAWLAVALRLNRFWLKVGAMRSWAQAAGERAATRRQLVHTSGVSWSSGD